MGNRRWFMSKIFRFTSKAVQLAKNAVGERDEVAAPDNE